MPRSVLVVASALVLLALGAMSAAAGNRHAHSGGQVAGATHAGAITALTTGTISEVTAVGDEEKAEEAAPAVPAAPEAAQAQADAQAEVGQPQSAQQGTDEEDDDEGEVSD